MCRVTESGDQCLRDWGRWAARDSTIRALGYPRCSAEQMANRVAGGDYEVNQVAELVDGLVRSMLEDRKRLVACLFYVERLNRGEVADRLVSIAKERGDNELVGKDGRVSVNTISMDLEVIRSMVGGVVLWVG